MMETILIQSIMQTLLIFCEIVQQILHCCVLERQQQKRAIIAGSSIQDLQDQPCRKKHYICYDRDAAKACINRDYLGPNPLFDDK